MIGEPTTRRVTVVGIDGCGKSSIIAALRESAAETFRLVTVTCPDFHDTPNAPLHRLSRQLKAFSDGADEVGSPVVKAVALYLQMTLFGPVERFFVTTYHPTVLVCERHPLIETMVYGPLYVRLGERGASDAAAQQAIRELLEQRNPGTLDTILAWHRAEAARLGTSGDMWALLGEIADVIGQGAAPAIAGFGDRYRTTLPDDVLWLDVPADQAEKRCAARSGTGALETHETTQHLAALRENYLRTRDDLADAFPQLRFHIVDTSDGVDLESSVRACITEGRLFG